MGAPKGNKFYLNVKKPGKPFAYTPDALWDKAQEYFAWVEAHPLWEMKVFNNQGSIVKAKVPKIRAMTEAAFCLFAGIDQDTFMDYKSGKGNWGKHKKIAVTIALIIYTQKFEGAAADLMNANIIVRELGLRDRTETEVKGVEAIRIIRDINV